MRNVTFSRIKFALAVALICLFPLPGTFSQPPPNSGQDVNATVDANGNLKPTTRNGHPLNLPSGTTLNGSAIGGGSGLSGGTSGHVITASGATTIADSGVALTDVARKSLTLSQFTGTNLNQIATRNFSDLQNKPIFYAADYGAVGDGITDDTSAFASALSAATSAGGGVVQLASKSYKIAGTLSVTDGVEIAGFSPGSSAHNQNGALQGVSDDSLTTGTTLLITGGSGAIESATATVTISLNGSVRNLKMYWPNQSRTAVTPTAYPYAIRFAQGASQNKGGGLVKDVELVNPYLGIDIQQSRVTIERVFGQAIAKGIRVDNAWDSVRLNNVHFNPFWSFASNVYTWQKANGIGFDIAKADDIRGQGCFAMGYNYAYRFTDNGNGSGYGNFMDCKSDDSNVSVKMEASQFPAITFVNSGFYADTYHVQQTGGYLKVFGSSFWGGASVQTFNVTGSSALFEFADNYIFNATATAGLVTGGATIAIHDNAWTQTGRTFSLTDGATFGRLYNNTTGGVVVPMPLTASSTNVVLDPWDASTNFNLVDALRSPAGGLSSYTDGNTRQILFSANGWFDGNATWHYLNSAIPGWRCDLAANNTASGDKFTIYHRAGGAAANSWTQYLSLFTDGGLVLGSSTTSPGAGKMLLTGLAATESGSSVGTWRGLGQFGGDNIALLVGERESQARIGAFNAALNAWSDLYIQPGTAGTYVHLGASGGSQVKLDDVGATKMLNTDASNVVTGTTLGSGVLTALGVNVGSAGAFVTNGGALGTPSSGTLTNATGLPITGITSSTSAQLRTLLSDENGTGAALFDGATSPTFVTPALGTPSALVVTNASGTASININGTVGATTPAAGTFTALTGTSGTLAGLTGLAIRDTSAAFDVTLAAVSSTTLTAGRTLTLNMGNVAHTLAFGTTAGTITFPNTAAMTVARTDAAQTFTGVQTMTSPAITTPAITTGINDANGNSMVAFTATASAVDGFTFTNAATANPATVTMAATGTDTNIHLQLTPKGTGSIIAGRDGLVATPAIRGSDTDSGIWFSGNNTRFSVDGQNAMQTAGGGIPVRIQSGGYGITNSTDASGTVEVCYGRNTTSVGEVTNGTTGQWIPLKLGNRDSGTTTVTNGLTIGHQSTGTPAAGLGSGILFNINDSTTADVNGGSVDVEWTTATHSSNISDYVVKLDNGSTTPAEKFRIVGSGGISWNGGSTFKKVLTATATLDFGSTAAGAAADLTMTVTGAVSGDVVSIGVPNGSVPAGGAFFGWVSAADTVTVRYIDNSLVTGYDPASGTFRAQVNQF